MLTSASLDDAARCRELGIRTYLPKPIKQADLLQMIRAVLNGQPERHQAKLLITAHPPTEDSRRFKVLLAEDNLVNQKVALRFLEKRGIQWFWPSQGKKRWPSGSSKPST